jgi:hypothetical protein
MTQRRERAMIRSTVVDKCSHMEIRQKRCFLLALAFLVSNAAWAQASRLAIGPETLQILIERALFTKQGRWYLLDQGPCYAYLESPKVHLADGRLYLDAHLSSRVGTEAFGSCVGVGFASNLTLSGRAVGSKSTLTLDEVRIDRVEDPDTADALNLLQQVAPQALPRAVSIDVLATARGSPASIVGFSISVSAFQIISVTTQPAGIMVDFALSLNAP